MNIELNDVRNLIAEKFNEINFIEESHQYFIGEDEYTPVSDIIKEFEEEVDWDEKAAKYAMTYGGTKESVKRQWDINRLTASIAGTRTHEFGESYTWLMTGHPELICQANKPQYVEEYNVLLPTYPKEESIVKFYNELPKNIVPVGAEFILSSKYIENARKICGTCDLLFYDTEKKGYIIGDWKTNASLQNGYKRKFNITMKEPFSNMVDDSFCHYVIQLNIYRRLLESIGLNIIGLKLIHLLPDGNYEQYDINKLDDDILNKAIMKKEGN